MRKNYTAFVLGSLLFGCPVSAQTIANFTTLAPAAQNQSLVIPSTHTFQRIIKTGDALSLGGTIGDVLDFTGYVPISGSSTNGYLSISSESASASCAILNISYNATTRLWQVSSSGNVSFPAADIGTVQYFCSGTVTPNNTIIVSEESTSTGDVNADGYVDRGWLIEINPATRTVINQNGTGGVDKLWAIGRAQRENAAIPSSGAVLYTGADNDNFGYLYKFVPTTPGNYSSGSLYVLTTTSSLGNGTWVPLANTTQADRNNTTSLATTAGAYNFKGVEDVEIGPDGKIYFAAKFEGKVYRFTDNGTYGAATDVTGLSVFVGNDAWPTLRSYDVDGAGPLAPTTWGKGNDNLTFDGEGNLWVLTDAFDASDNNNIWVVAPTHTQASPQVKIFGIVPTGAEPTGLTFSPDYKYGFLSIQHPSANTASQIDAAGTSVVFNTSTTLVIARKEFLGPLEILPLSFTDFSASRGAHNNVELSWTVENISKHQFFAIERSVDGVKFEEIGRNSEDINGVKSRTLTFSDTKIPDDAAVLYYRLRQCDADNQCKYSETRSVKIALSGGIRQLYPQPAAGQLNISYNAMSAGKYNVTVTDISGKRLILENRNLAKGIQNMALDTRKLVSGVYMLTITDQNGNIESQKFVK
jgi:hypothetical protein